MTTTSILLDTILEDEWPAIFEAQESIGMVMACEENGYAFSGTGDHLLVKGVVPDTVAMHAAGRRLIEIVDGPFDDEAVITSMSTGTFNTRIYLDRDARPRDNRASGEATT